MTVGRRVRRRFYIETGLTVASFVLLVATLINQEWIEVVFGVDPDHGDGSLEWLVAAAVAIIAIIGATSARSEWRRSHVAADSL
ncbi:MULTISPECIES: hypothetical protein [unclassified Frankia]|uniref:hypothetical protein n=1 Tax=unclassified Frankia TaxID=2632575 RepID=UPI002023DDC3